VVSKGGRLVTDNGTQVGVQRSDRFLVHGILRPIGVIASIDSRTTGIGYMAASALRRKT
jgi:hypothetical protein